MSQFKVGDKVVNTRSFTTPIGVHFSAGTMFTVNLAGRSIRLVADRCGSIAWISDGWFLATEAAR